MRDPPVAGVCATDLVRPGDDGFLQVLLVGAGHLQQHGSDTDRTVTQVLRDPQPPDQTGTESQTQTQRDPQPPDETGTESYTDTARSPAV